MRAWFPAWPTLGSPLTLYLQALGVIEQSQVWVGVGNRYFATSLQLVLGKFHLVIGLHSAIFLALFLSFGVAGSVEPLGAVWVQLFGDR